jgi:hypothetical protein
MIIRRRFRPLGKLLQRFGRGQINNYTHTTNMASRADVPPLWQDDVQQPLNWADPDVRTDVEPADFGSEAAPRVQRRAVQRAPQQPPSAPAAPADAGPRRTPPDLWKIHELHTKMLDEAGYKMPPSPWAQPVDPETASPLPAPPSGSKPTVQRRPQTPSPDPTSSRPPGITPTPAPPIISGRRRGRVIEEKTPMEMDESQPEEPADDTPGWETELETGEDRPDLFEALMSEGVVQRRPNPDLSDAETFTPKFRPTPPQTPAAQQSTSRSPSAPDAPDSAPNIQRRESAQPPRTERAARTQPIPPPEAVQRQPAPQDAASEFYADDEADMPPSLVPAPGTTEADLLDMLGLPPDTPVRGLNPAAATPPGSASAPVQCQPAPPDVQRAESTPPTQASAAAQPTPPARPQINVPPTSPYKSQETGEQIDPDEDEPVGLAGPSVMRQPAVPESADEDDWSEPPAVASFTSFFEAAETAVTGSSWPENAPDEPLSSDWAGASDTDDQPGESLPRANPFPSEASSSAPTRPTPRVQRAPAETDLPSFDAPETLSEFDDTQPFVPFAPGSSTSPDTGSRIQRAAAPHPEIPGEPYPRSVDPSLLTDEEWGEPQDFWSADDSADSDSVVSPSTLAPTSVQRAEAPFAPTQQSGPDHDSASIGYHIEGLSESRGTAPTGRISRAKSGGTTEGDKLGGKTVPEGMSMELPSKTTTDTVSSSVTAPSGSSPTGGSKTGDSNLSGKTGGAAPGGSANTGNTSPSTTEWWEPAMSADEAGPMSSTGSSSAAPEDSSDSSPDNEAGGQGDVDKLARDVYNLLRDRLRVEQERRPKR